MTSLLDLFHENGSWIGGMVLKDGSILWSDGSSPAFKPKGFSPKRSSEPRCLFQSQGKWEALDCRGVERPFSCQFDLHKVIRLNKRHGMELELHDDHADIQAEVEKERAERSTTTTTEVA